MPHPLPPRDTELVQIVDAALADTTCRSGEWLVCKLGCTQCCVGVFAINTLDAIRLQHGLAELDRIDPERAERVRGRALASLDRIRNDFPGDPNTGILDKTDEAAARFEEFANDEPCPALDPSSGGCDLYAARPMTCRVFGPPVRSERRHRHLRDDDGQRRAARGRAYRRTGARRSQRPNHRCLHPGKIDNYPAIV
jgi:Fe-S-cluster containining protein